MVLAVPELKVRAVFHGHLHLGLPGYGRQLLDSLSMDSKDRVGRIPD